MARCAIDRPAAGRDDVRAKVLPQIRQVGNITVPPDARGQVEREGLQHPPKTDLEPGRYQLRIALAPRNGGGSVIYTSTCLTSVRRNCR
jgi:hypothetical protein